MNVYKKTITDLWKKNWKKPKDAFVNKPLKVFSVNMMIEMVNIIVSSVIRVAEIIDIMNDKIKVLYDGFFKRYTYWVDNCSLDIHPIDCYLNSDHPIEILPCKNI